MMMSFERYIPSMRRLLAAALLLLGVSCVKEDPIANLEDPMDDDGRILISASIAANEQTRSDNGDNENLYIEEGVVDRGTYYMYYSTPSSADFEWYHKMATVEFGHPEGPTTGYAYYMENGKRKDVKWIGDVSGQGTTSLTYYLTNVRPELYTLRGSIHSNTYYGTLYKYSYFLRFKKDGNPYVASPLDEVYGTNDLLGCFLDAKLSSTPKLAFKLNHALSLLQIVIEVYPAETEGFELDLSKASIKITNVDTRVAAYALHKYYSTTFTHEPNPERDFSTETTDPSKPSNYSYVPGYTQGMEANLPVYLVNSNSEYREEAQKADEKEAWKYRVWESVSEDTAEGSPEDKTPTPKVYTTKRFVMPPQTLPPTGSRRPELVVCIAKRDMGYLDAGLEDTVYYHGYIPELMIDSSGTPQTIALQSGTQLTIRATINSPEPGLIFAPVKVEPWSRKGSHTFNMRQAGIYNAADFKALLDLYAKLQEEDPENPLTDKQRTEILNNLERYGYKNEHGDLIFQLWASMTLYDDKIAGKMPVSTGLNPGDKGYTPDFSFMFNGYAVTTVEKNPTSEPGESGGEGGDETPDDNGSIAPDENDNYEVKRTYTSSADQLDFYNLLTGTGERAFVGIHDKATFLKVVEMLQNPEIKITEVMQYGVLNNVDDSMIFDIEASFDLKAEDFEKIYQQVPAKLWDYNIQFVIHQGETVKVSIPLPEPEPEPEPEEPEEPGTDPNPDPDPEPEPENAIVIECTSEYSPLDRLMSKRDCGAVSADDFYFLVDCYNEYAGLNPALKLLDLFAPSVSSATDLRVFYIRKSITLDGEKVYLKMLPNTSVSSSSPDYRPIYSISGLVNSSSTTTPSIMITVRHEIVPAATYDNTYFYNMLSGKGQATSNGTTVMNNIVSYYNNSSMNKLNYQYFWRYGRFDFEENKWIFPLNYTSNVYCTYSSLFGKMIPNPDAGKYDYEFELNNSIGYYVTSMPKPDDETGEPTSSTEYHYFYKDSNGIYKYPNTAAELKLVANGEYWDWLKEYLKASKEPEPDPAP